MQIWIVVLMFVYNETFKIVYFIPLKSLYFVAYKCYISNYFSSKFSYWIQQGRKVHKFLRMLKNISVNWSQYTSHCIHSFYTTIQTIGRWDLNLWSARKVANDSVIELYAQIDRDGIRILRVSLLRWQNKHIQRGKEWL